VARHTSVSWNLMMSRVNLEHSIDEKKRVAVRESPENRADVQALRISHGLHPRSGAPGSRNEFDPSVRCAPKTTGRPCRPWWLPKRRT
jgi:hypothetical protein